MNIFGGNRRSADQFSASWIVYLTARKIIGLVYGFLLF
jgi:hypothetical protein